MTTPDSSHDRMPMYAAAITAAALVFLFIFNRAFVRVSVG